MMNHPLPLPSPLVKDVRLDDPYVAAGDRAYLVGAQSGAFPPIGHHISGQMGGMWAHPWKMLDGFWCAVHPASEERAPDLTPDEGWLVADSRFESLPWGVRQWFDLPTDGLRVSRTLIVPDGVPALIIDLTLIDTGGHARELDLTFLVTSNLRAGWSSFEDPEPAGQDIAHVDGTTGVIVAVDPTATWAVAWG